MAAEEVLQGRLTAQEIRQAIQKKEDAGRWLFHHVIQRLPVPFRDALPWVAALRRFDQDLLKEVLADFQLTLSPSQFQKLIRFGFILKETIGYRCHDFIQRIQRQQLWHDQPEATRKFLVRCSEVLNRRWNERHRQEDFFDYLFYRFFIEAPAALELWEQAIQAARKDWNRELWGQLIALGKAVVEETLPGAVTVPVLAQLWFQRGLYHYYQNQWNQALSSYEAALGLYQQVGDRLGEANTRRAIGDVQRFKDEYDQALSSYEAALGLYQQVGDRLGEANTLQA
ncbi:MAG: tetratricopeptide repeat protein, partial [Calditrichaeota bacterium]